ncbi:MAG: hypothetical protein D6767_04260 [Candidatus Hydrogenedentota bacterium]|nr:MAG: hypothetical protein D6767_04260 [Candidatus Hydrogenedentota bacterium]
MKHKIVILFMIFISGYSCKDKAKKILELKWERFRQIDQIERLYTSIKKTVQLEQDKNTSEIFKATYRKQLEKFADKLKEKLAEVQADGRKIRKLVGESEEAIYFKPENLLTTPVQIGLAIENKQFKKAYLDSLKKEKITVIGRVLEAKDKNFDFILTMRIPIAEKVLETNRIVLIYFKLKDRREKPEAIRKYEDVQAKIDVKKYKIIESGQFTIVLIDGNLRESKKLGWLGIRSWKDEPAMLPAPTMKKRVRVAKTGETQEQKPKNTKSKKENKKPVEVTKTNNNDDTSSITEDDDDFFGD